ncbi:acyl-CoA dehydrogenase family member 10 isoform X4 [Tachysurus fulvidraco]|uniref:acyl-CoA dehydrogenase family member 10 isoform X4 n=1 Tax=Tachysurus fulvidraco TaxID=1234273 RepID=UPI001FED30F9|nr:acyl-CoA dehydrogenase family member 10 isoform X4 [Tachysurus fulvidraco]
MGRMTGVSWFLRVKPPFHRRVCSSSSPRAIIFDMFGVLIPSPIPKATEWENENFVPAGTIGQAIKTGGNNNSWSKYMRGELGPEEFVEAFSRDCSQIAGFKVHIGPLHSALTGGSMSQPVTVMIDAVQRARVEGFKTAVLSNNFLLPGGKSYLPLNTSFFDVVRDHELAVKELEKVLKIPLSVYSSGTLSVSQNQQLTQYLKKATQLPLTENIIMRHLSQSYLTDSTYLLTCGQHQFVLKKKRSSEALQKECRLNVLREAKFPVPSVIYQDEMSSNVLGTPFYLTFYCPGRVFIDHSIPGEDSCGKRCVYETMIKTLCQINRVDLETTSLENRRDPENPDVRAVLGWSLSTVGDPLVDVATCCMSHFLPATASTQPGRFFAMMGILSAEEIFDLYRKEMGLEYIPNWQFYMAFCSFRQAAILQTNYKTSLKVTRNTNKVEDIVHLAWDFATKEGFRVFNALP